MPRNSNGQKELATERADRLFRDADRLGDAGKHRQAFKLFLEAAELGDASAQLSLGNYYASGTGTRKNLAEAERWYKKAYKTGISSAANNLAIDKRDAQNFRSAILWFKKAVALEDGDAAVELAKLYIKLNRTPEALAALKQALAVPPSYISEDGREQAEALLEQLIS